MSANQIHPTSVVDPRAELAGGVEIGPYVVVLGPVRIGAGTRIHAHAVVEGPAEIGERNEIFSNTVVGGAPQDLKYRGEPTLLRIGNRNVIREGVTVNRGTVTGGGETVLGDGNLLMANAHVAHDCNLGSHVILANNVMLAGHVKVLDGAILNGGAGVHHFTTIGRFAYVGGLSRITQDVPPFMIVEGHPSRVRGVNVIGLRRARIPEGTVRAIKDAYKRLFRSDLPVRETVAALDAEYAGVPEVRELAAFLRASEMGRQGRQQEDPERRLAP